MSDPLPEQLIRAEELMYNGKGEEALEIIINFEKRSDLTPRNKLSALLLRGWVYSTKIQFEKPMEMGERTYTMSQELGLVSETIEALILKVYSVFLGKIEEAFNHVLEAEKLLRTLPDSPPYNYFKIADLNLFLKSWVYFYKNDLPLYS